MSWYEGATVITGDDPGGEAGRIWRELQVDRIKVNYGDYRNDLEPLLKWRTPRGWYSVGRVKSGWDPCELAEQIQKERGLLNDGDVFDDDPVEVIRWLVDEYRFEQALERDGEAVRRYQIQAQGLTDEEAEAAGRELLRQATRSRRPKSSTHYRRAGDQIPARTRKQVENLPADDFRTACYIMWKAGLRLAECLDLTWEDLRVKPGMVFVRRGKGGKSRYVPIVPDLERELTRLIHRRRNNGGCSSTDHVIQMGRAAIQARCARTLDIGPHMLRHTFGYDMGRVLDIDQLAVIMGHSNTDITRKYRHAAVEDIAAKMKESRA